METGEVKENIYENVKKELNEDKIIEILMSMLDDLQSGETQVKIQEAKVNAGQDMIAHMKLVFPIVVESQIRTIAKHLPNFPPNKDGLKDFLMIVNEFLRSNEAIFDVFTEIKHVYLPPTD